MQKGCPCQVPESFSKSIMTTPLFSGPKGPWGTFIKSIFKSPKTENYLWLDDSKWNSMLKNVFGDPVWPKLQKLFNENPSKIDPRVKLPRIDTLFGHNSVNFWHREILNTFLSLEFYCQSSYQQEVLVWGLLKIDPMKVPQESLGPENNGVAMMDFEKDFGTS